MPHISAGQIGLFRYLQPSIEEQRAIASVLRTLDDKIELNCRMNETLEALARAIFTSWFVDFDPVRAKAEGRQPIGTGAETTALFFRTASWTHRSDRSHRAGRCCRSETPSPSWVERHHGLAATETGVGCSARVGSRLRLVRAPHWLDTNAVPTRLISSAGKANRRASERQVSVTLLTSLMTCSALGFGTR